LTFGLSFIIFVVRNAQKRASTLVHNVQLTPARLSFAMILKQGIFGRLLVLYNKEAESLAVKSIVFNRENE